MRYRRADKEVVIAAVKENNNALQLASDKLKNDIDVIQASKVGAENLKRKLARLNAMQKKKDK